MPETRPIATRPMPALYGGFIQVPAYVVAGPRKRGAISDWLADRRAQAQANSSKNGASHDR